MLSPSTAISWETAPDILTVAEAAILANTTQNGIRAAIRLGLLPATNFGIRRTRIAKEALREVFRRRSELSDSTAAFGRVPEA